MPNFTRSGNDKGIGLPKQKFLLRFYQNSEYKRLAGAYPLRNFHKIYKVYTSFQDAVNVKIWVDLIKGLRTYGGFKLRGRVSPQIFTAPYSGESMRRTPKSF